MHSDRIPESTKQWLQNEDFILWCLAPTQESEEWWVNYQKEHPEDQASLQEARKIILSARLNPVQRLPEESERLCQSRKRGSFETWTIFRKEARIPICHHH